MATSVEPPRETCVVCNEDVPSARMSLMCTGCGAGLHPGCAARVDRGPGWGDRTMFCPACATVHDEEADGSLMTR